MTLAYGTLGDWYVHVDGLPVRPPVLHYCASFWPQLEPRPGDEYHQPIVLDRRFSEVIRRKQGEAASINADRYVVLSHDRIIINRYGEREVKRCKPAGWPSPYAGLWRADKAYVIPARRDMLSFEGVTVYAEYELTFTIGQLVDGDLLRPCDR